MGKYRSRVDEINENMGQEGLRVLALAQRDIDPADFDPQSDLQTYVEALLLMGLVGMDEPAQDLMQCDPRPSNEKIMDRRTSFEYLFIGFFIAVGPIIAASRVFTREVMPDTNLLGRTMVLVTLGLIHIVVAYSSRSETKSILDRDSLPSRQFNVRAGISLLLILVVTEFGFLQRWFDTTRLSRPSGLQPLAGLSLCWYSWNS